MKSDFNDLLFLLSDGDLSKIESVKKTKVYTAYKFLYLKRTNNLNEALASIPKDK